MILYQRKQPYLHRKRNPDKPPHNRLDSNRRLVVGCLDSSLETNKQRQNIRFVFVHGAFFCIRHIYSHSLFTKNLNEKIIIADITMPMDVVSSRWQTCKSMSSMKLKKKLEKGVGRKPRLHTVRQPQELLRRMLMLVLFLAKMKTGKMH